MASETDQVLVSLKPSLEAPAHVLTDFAKIPAPVMKERLLLWQDVNTHGLGSYSFALEDDPRPEVSNLLTLMVHNRAFPGNPSALDSDTALAPAPLVEDLVSRAILVKEGSGYVLTKTAMRHLCAMQSVGHADVFFKRREGIPLCDQSSWEVMEHLLEDGWTWKRMPRTDVLLELGLGFVHHICPTHKDHKKVWFTASTRVSHSYLCALAECKCLLTSGIVQLHHGQRNEYYDALLEVVASGDATLALPAKAPTSVVRRKRPALLDEHGVAFGRRRRAQR